VVVSVLTCVTVSSAAAQRSSEPNTSEITSPSDETPFTSLEELHSELAGFGLDFARVYTSALDELIENEPDLASRRYAVEKKVNILLSSSAIATNANPRIALLDMAVLVTLERNSVSAVWGPKYFPEKTTELNRILDEYLVRAWELVNRVFEPETVDELRSIIENWWSEHDNEVDTTMVRMRDFAASRRTITSVATGKKGLRASLASGMQTVDETRMMAERQAGFLRVLPTIVAWQAELLYYRIMMTPEAAAQLENVDEMTEDMDDLAGIDDTLPDLLAEQREAGLDRFAAIVTSEREAAMNDAAQIADERIQKAIDESLSLVEQVWWRSVALLAILCVGFPLGVFVAIRSAVRSGIKAGSEHRRE
jgi:hypothetical protein